MKKFFLLTLLAVLLISLSMFLLFSREGIKIPIYKGAYKIERLKKGKNLGLSYNVRLKYPDEINDVFHFYDYYLSKKGWKRESTKDFRWDSFEDIKKTKVNYLTYRWTNHQKRKDFLLIIRYEIELQKEEKLKEIEEQVTIVISSFY